MLERQEAVMLLKGRGITPTKQRVEIAQYLFARPQHVSAEQVLDLVNAERPRVSKATIYNTLNLFSRKGLIRAIVVDPTKVFYDSNTIEHHHFYDVERGELSDVPAAGLRVENLPEPPEGMVAEAVDVVIRIRRRN